GTGSGLLRFNKGKFTNLSGNQVDFFIESMWLDESSKKLWIGTRDSGIFIYDISKNTYEKIENQFSKDLINTVISDSRGTMWAGSEKNGVASYQNGTWTYYSQKDGLLNTEVNCIYADETNNLYVGTTSGLYVKQGQRFTAQAQFDGIPINKIKKDKEDNLWVLTVNGLFVKAKTSTAWRHLDKTDGLSNNDLRDIYFDSEGSIWLATYRGGLNQLRETKFITYSSDKGIEVEAAGAIHQLKDNRYLIGTSEGKLFTIENGKAKPFPIKTSLSQRIYGILQDQEKNLWVTSYDGLLLITADGKEKLFTEKDGLPTRQLRSIYQHSNKDIWIGSRTSGLIKMKYNSTVPAFDSFKFDELNKLNSTFIMSIDEDSAGNLLVGSNTGGLNIISPDGTIQNYGKDKGLISNVTYCARTDPQQVIWIATSDGLSRIENGNVFNFTKKEGLPHESIFDCIEDNHGYLWMPTARGIIRVQKQQLNDYKEGKIKSIAWKLFDKNDELRNSECTGATHAFKSLNGTLWFKMFGGAVAVDPSSITLNERKLNSHIEKVVVDDKEFSKEDQIVLKPGSRRIAISYIAPSLRYPKTARYRYMLENFDERWIDAGPVQQAVYTSLPYGQYTFRVIACNNDGIWNQQGAAISFTILPHYYQTWWFFLLTVLMAGGLVYGYINIRVRTIKKQSALLEKKVEERTRLIAEQRDELLTLNEELQSSQEEVMLQRDVLAGKNEEIASINSNLEKMIAERTSALETQNKQLSDYAFINAHKLRAPIASILGLIDLLSKTEPGSADYFKLLDHLTNAATNLDQVVRSINQMLEKDE
ncbi:MAG: hypothetical protein L0Y35_01190, partial [Flammeovirgaceae bacterium]|nr:hypothetical protein [Flammeovirgaceae bacterium]